MDEWQIESNETEGIQVKQHTTFAARLTAAKLCAGNLGLTIPTLVDGMDNAAFEAFSAWPERIYIVDKDGKIHYCGGHGPYDFKPPEARALIAELLEE